MVRFKINGKSHTFDGDGEMPLLWYLRDIAGLKGTKFGCGIAQCGACTVHVDDAAVRSCSLPMSAADGTEVTTIEGLARNGRLHAVQRAWIAEDVPQCGYCQTGQVMAVAEFLSRVPEPSDKDIDDNITNLCRCGTYVRIRKAIKRAAALMKEEAGR
jgi:isoquinoline 1-oxidoreductase alpha subunit